MKPLRYACTIPAGALEERLRRFASLTPTDIEVVRRASVPVDRCPARTDCIIEGTRVDRPYVLLSGWAASYRVLADGRRQIVGIALPGDLLGCSPTPLSLPALSIMAVTETILGDATELGQILANGAGSPSPLRTALMLAKSIDDAILVDHAVRLGRLNAYERMVDLLIELHTRLTWAGLAAADRFPLPLTQELLADTLGLSIVHVNRTLQQLRRERVLDLVRGEAVIRVQSAFEQRREVRPAWERRLTA